MVRNRIEENAAAITLSSGWTRYNISDATTYSGTEIRASGGYFSDGTSPGLTATIAVPSGTTAVLLHAPYTAYGLGATVSVDGVTLPTTWSQSSHTTDTTVAFWHRACYPPIYVNPTIAHTITLTGYAAGIALDCVDFYTAEGPYATVTGIGHSIMYGYPGPGTVPTPYCQQLAAWLGYTATNIGVSSETLAQGTADATSYLGNGMPPAWARADAYATWEGTKPAIALIMYGLNDVRVRGDNDPAGGGNYGLAQVQQRIRELIWKINCNTPATQIFVIGTNWLALSTWQLGAPYTHGGTYDNNGSTSIWRAWDAGIAAVCAESTSLNTTFVPLFSLTAIKNSALLTDGTHPSQEGHTLIAAELVGRVLARGASGSGRTGRVGGVF